MYHRLALTRALATASFLLLLPGCILTPKHDPARYYVLPVVEPTEKVAATEPQITHLNIASFRIPAYLDRSELVWHTAGNRVGISDTDLWLEPLSKGSTRVFAQYLARHLNIQSITYPPNIPDTQALRVSVDIFQFQINPDTEVLLKANWQFSQETGRASTRHDGTLTLRIPLPANSSLDTSVSAMSAALDQLAAELASQIRKHTSPK